MKLKWKRVLPVSFAVIVLVGAAASVVFAQDPTDGQDEEGNPSREGWFGRRGPGGGGFILG